MCLLFHRLSQFRSLLFVAFVTVIVGGISYASDGHPASYCEDNPSACYQPSVVYGNDDRTDVYAYQGDPYWVDVAHNAVVALVRPSNIDMSNPDDVRFFAPTLQQYYNLCSSERFINQPVAAFCSGILIDNDLVLTAGQCVRTQTDCANTRLVFRFLMQDTSALETITSDDVFRCQEIVVSEYSSTIDYAVLRLDRPATPRFTPVDIVGTDASTVPNGTPLVVIGTPSGIPFKIEDGGAVRDNRQGVLDYFVANNDTFAGNSGSGVWNLETREIVGILVRGENDYVINGSCFQVNHCSDTGCRGEDSTYAFHAVEALCNSGILGRFCSCGNEICDPDETSVNCWQDCGTICGDGACNGGETLASCPEDCKAGTSCQRPIVIPTVLGEQVFSGDTRTSTNNASPSCAGSNAPDNIYTFTLDSPRRLGAQVSGFDTVLYLRQACDNPTAELACNDDSTPPGGLGSRINQTLPPGTYFLFVDGFSDNAGAYTLTIEFTTTPCDSAIPISPSGTQNITGDTSSTYDYFTPNCSTSTAPDRIYTFTLNASVWLGAQVSGFDTVLYLRQACDNPTAELACNDDSTPPGDYGSRIQASLVAGTYYLIVDGYNMSSGSYNLEVTFEPAGCTSDDQCDDGIFCNGVETCTTGICPGGYCPSQCESGQNPCGQYLCVEVNDSCTGCINDYDCDGFPDISDNCPNASNPNQEDSDGDLTGDMCDNCPNTLNRDQQDSYPSPRGNGIGDACECEGNFDGDRDCDGTDAAMFKFAFGRNSFNNPCIGVKPCNGDFDCDHDCDGTDAARFKSDFGRSAFNKLCPTCKQRDWCVYP